MVNGNGVNGVLGMYNENTFLINVDTMIVPL